MSERQDAKDQAVERMARALAFEDGYEDWDALGPHAHAYYRRNATVALTAALDSRCTTCGGTGEYEHGSDPYECEVCEVSGEAQVHLAFVGPTHGYWVTNHHGSSYFMLPHQWEQLREVDETGMTALPVAVVFTEEAESRNLESMEANPSHTEEAEK